MNERGRPIGVFDSGVGGLTVLREMAALLPHEHLLYLGDTARVPYGTKSPATVIRYAEACAGLLTDRDIKLLVVACNTASAYGIDALRDALEVPVVGVVEPGARRAVGVSRGGRIGVLGTAGTIASGAYQDAIGRCRADAVTLARPCPLFVPLAEEGWTAGEVPEAVARTYVEPVVAEGADTLLLGCTHYPLLTDVIQTAAGPEVAVIDSAAATADVVAETLEAFDLLNPDPGEGLRHYLVTDDPARFADVGARFLGERVGGVEWVDIGDRRTAHT
jgi:glutamate racemase